MGSYPISIEMTGRPCVVIGGGVVAERKVQGLLETSAEVTVISPNLTESLHLWVREGKLAHKARKYLAGDLEGYDLAFVATDDPHMNSSVAREGKKNQIWVNAADDPSHCDFILPSVLKRGDLTVAVSTGGASPALSRAIREGLEFNFTEDHAELAHMVAQVRRELRRRSLTPSPEAWRQALNESLFDLIAKGKKEEARAYLMEQLV
ncbi:MAG: bifunctional precorrin-2 dehydrogenase/sirohydrochlorin ferrochelatase [Candidatus Binatia bacterium]|jgi:siroheme synthase-like protein|nr:bifunctional precorrin-2 dehydrogenase/sirohydrochlorin ferrochelatase [Candidatus Binatia bacterium]